MTSRSLAVVLVLGAIASVSCGTGTPAFIWVPGENFRVDVAASCSADSDGITAVGDWVELHADRESGPWVRIATGDLKPGTQWLRRPPPSVEENVQANVRWHVEPEGVAEFNVPNTQDLFSRRVRFAEPGVYTVWATTQDWQGGRASSNRLTVSIAP